MSAQAMTLSERADACLAALDDTGRAIARKVLLRLISFGEAGADTRRAQPVSALDVGGDPTQLPAILRQLVDARLLAIDGDDASGNARVELADEALIGSWPALQAWIRSHRSAEQLRRQLESDAAAWSRQAGEGHGDLGLLDKAQLRELAGWLTAETRRDLGVSAAAESFVVASRAAAARGRWWPGKATAGSVLAIMLILLILATPIVLLFIVVLTASVIHALG